MGTDPDGLGDLPDWFDQDDALPPPEPPKPGGRRRLLFLGPIVLGMVAAGVAMFSVASHDRAAPAPAGPSSPASPSRETPTTTPKTAVAALADLVVKGRAPRTGFDRMRFGQPWADTNHNGCDTRNDILRRDLTEKVMKRGTHGCVVLKGLLHDPYTGGDIPFRRGWNSSLAVQIDHVVALSDAWQKGAQPWSDRRRERLANDPLELLAVDGPANQAKSDGDAATWLPPNKPYRCEYVARQIAVKKKYGLWVTAAEKDAMARALKRCPDEPLPSG